MDRETDRPRDRQIGTDRQTGTDKQIGTYRLSSRTSKVTPQRQHGLRQESHDLVYLLEEIDL